MAKTYTASLYGREYLVTPSFEELKGWMRKNMPHLDKFQFYTSDYDGGCGGNCDCTKSCIDTGFTDQEEDELQDLFGVIV